MKLTLSWLKEHLETVADAKTIAAKLTSIGLEVESVTDAAAALKDFIVAEILTAEKHPNADKLKLCSVNSGEGAPLQIVCGAPNARAGLKVVLARPGTVIPASGEALKIGTIRGVESRGMMCSARELLLGEDHDGIIELSADAAVGSPAAGALTARGLLSTDPVFDVSITPNRGDAASVWGIARDLAAAGLGQLKTEKVQPVAGKFPSPRKITLDFSPEDKSACPIFAGRLIRGVKNGPAPKWVQERFKTVGMKSISALVDATNFVAQDRGRPLHVFDADKLSGNLHARMANDHEQLLALDEKTYVLDKDTIVIADDSFARGIAGIMGGMDTGSFEDTKNVFIESAWFDPARIARAGRRLGIISDARYRFERGVDPEFVLPGLELVTRLILEWCGGEASDVVIAGALPPPHKHIEFDPGLVETLGGIRVPRQEIIAILQNLGFVVAEHATLHVTPPSWRRDIDGPADLVEEVVRIHGLADVPSVGLARDAAVAKPVLTGGQRRARAVRRTLAARGFNECVSFSFVARQTAKLFGGGDEARQLSNPIASDLDAMRPSLLPSLLAAAQRNAARGLSELNLFEIGAAFQSGMPGAQTTNAAGLIMGAGTHDWSKSGHPADAFDAKGALLAALEAAAGSPMGAPVTRGAPSYFHPGRSGVIALGPKQIANFGELHPKILAAFDIKVPAAAFEIILDALPESKSSGPKTKAQFSPSPFQAIERDFAFVVDRPVAAGDMIRAVKNAERTLIDSVTLFDVYEGKGIADGKKSIAISVRLQPKDKTLTDAEIEAVAQKIIAAALKLGATLRSWPLRNPFDARSGLIFVVAFGIVSLFADMAYEGMRAISGPFLASLGASGFAVGVIGGVSGLAGYALRLFSGRAADSTRLYWPITLAGYVLQMAAVPALALAGSWQVAALLIVLERAGKAIRNPPRDVMLSRAGEHIGQGWAFGLHEALDQTGAVMGPLVAALVLALRHDYREAFAWLAVPAAITLLLVTGLRFSYSRAGDIAAGEAVTTGNISPAFRSYAIAVALVAFGFADYSLIAFHFARSGAVSPTWIPLFYALAMGTAGAASLSFGRWYDRRGLWVLLPATLLGALVAPLVFLGDFWMALTGTALWGVALGVHESVMSAAIADMVPLSGRARAYGLFTAIFGIAWFAGSSVLGFLYDKSLIALTALSVLVTIAALVPLGRAIRAQKPAI